MPSTRYDLDIIFHLAPRERSALVASGRLRFNALMAAELACYPSASVRVRPVRSRRWLQCVPRAPRDDRAGIPGSRPPLFAL